MMKYYLNILLYLCTITGFSQNDGLNLDKETKETIEWINSKFIQNQLKTSEVKQINTFKEVRLIKGEYYLMGERIQDYVGIVSHRIFAIPINKINSISYIDHKSNIWLEIRMKNNEKVILETRDGENWNMLDNISFILSTSIENNSLKSRFKKAFNYLMELYGNESEEKF